MNPQDAPGDAAPDIDSPAGWQAAVVWGVDAAMARGARRITCVDPGFESWPLDDPAFLLRLTAWLRLPQRRLVLLARHYDAVPRWLPRFTAWRRDFAHAIEAWQAPPEMSQDLPALLLDDGPISVHLIDRLRWRGRTAVDQRTAMLWRERIDVVLQRSEPGFGVSALGL